MVLSQIELTDLSELNICKCIAEIENDTETLECFAFYDDKEYQTPFYLKQKEKVLFSQINNPIKDDALCFQLIKKHNIVRKYESYDQMGFYYTDLENSLKSADENIREAFLVDEHGDNKAALLAIISANNTTNISCEEKEG